MILKNLLNKIPFGIINLIKTWTEKNLQNFTIVYQKAYKR